MEINLYLNSIGISADYFIPDIINIADNGYLEMKEDDFRKILTHLPMDMLSIGGLDPLRHTDIHSLLNAIREYRNIKYLKIYVSSIDDERLWTSLIQLRKNLDALVLCFAPHGFPESDFDRLRQCLQRCRDSDFEIQFLVSITPDPKSNQKIVSACKELKIKDLLWFLPCNGQESSAQEYYDTYKIPLNAFLRSTTLNKIRTTAFCQGIPFCILNRDELMTFALSGHNLDKVVCEPVIHIMPDLKIKLCNLDEYVFDSNTANHTFLSEIEKMDQIVHQLQRNKLFEQCDECKFFRLKQVSCGCNFLKLNQNGRVYERELSVNKTF